MHFEYKGDCGMNYSYFRRNTQRHCECWLMTPPTMGPKTLAMMKTVATTAMYFPYFATGTMVGAMTMIME